MIWQVFDHFITFFFSFIYLIIAITFLLNSRKSSLNIIDRLYYANAVVFLAGIIGICICLQEPHGFSCNSIYDLTDCKLITIEFLA